MNALYSQFRDALAQSGIAPPPGYQFVVDDQIHRYTCEGDKDDASWYALHVRPGDNGAEPVYFGAYGRWGRLDPVAWCSRQRNSLSQEELAEFGRTQKELAAKRAAAEQAARDAARNKVNAFFARFPRAKEGDSLYLLAKGVPVPHGTSYISTDDLTSGWLALPLVDTDDIIHSAQFIADDGTKRFQYGGRVSGLFYRVSSVPGGPVLICEGYATGASLYEATGWTVVCALNCGNLCAVAKAFRALYPERTIVLCADNDQFTDGNPGLAKAREALKAIRSGPSLIACPEFADEALADKPTDFNDLHQNEGLAEVRRQVFSAFPVVARPIGILSAPPQDDPTELLRYRYLCECGSLLLNGATGLGKSSLGIQAAACWANGLDFFGIYPTKRLRIVIVQAENDDGDVAQVRDGICRGLNLSLEQRQTFFNNVLVYSSRGLTGKRFCQEVLRPLLDLHQPHILQLDPMLAFLGGNVKEQEVVGQFVREYLNPLLFQSKAACMGLHHTNKPPSGREKSSWVNGELAYTGTGSAEWANWARAILAVQSTGATGYYTLHAAKRGGRLGWAADNNSTNPTPDLPVKGQPSLPNTQPKTQLVYEKPIAWSREKGVIYWRSPAPRELDDAISSAAESSASVRRSGGPAPKFTPDQLLSLISNSTYQLTTAEWRKKALDELGVPRATFYRILRSITEDRKAVQSIQSERWSIPTPTPYSND